MANGKQYHLSGKNCIVTGGSGFIGQNLVKKLINEGANVWVIDNFSFGSSKKSLDKKSNLIEGDVRDKSILNQLPDIKFDYYFHFAAPSSIVLFNKDLELCREITIQGFLNAIDFCRSRNIRLIYPSTGSLYSGAKAPHSEETILNLPALNEYAKVKLELEKIQKENPEVSSLGLRIFAGYGPGEYLKGEFASVPYLFAKDMLENNSPVIFGDGAQTRDFIFIEDVIEAIITLAENAKEPIINIGSGTSVSFNQIVSILNKLLNTNIKPKYIERPPKYLETTLADTALLNKYYRPKWDMEKGLAETIKDIKEKKLAAF